MLLEVETLDVRYGRNRAVRGVSLAVEAGEIVTVLGANGAGKSSLLRAIMGAAPIAAGRIRFDGRDITRRRTPGRVAAGLALVPEGRRILISLSVEENLRMGAYCRSDETAVRRDLARVYDRFPNLAERRHMPASVLSGGEQQMLAIGRALLARPRLMMLDEPSLGLSPILVARLFVLLAEINRDGIALLLVEQNTHKALGLAARGYVLELGCVALAGPARELLANRGLQDAYLGRADSDRAG